jgi:uncharacterized protein (TIGR03435 family)
MLLAQTNQPGDVVLSGSTEKALGFEVATIKEVNLSIPEEIGPVVYPGGRIRIRGFPLKALISVAFRLSYWQIAGGDDWTRGIRYDLEAKPPETFSAKPLDLRYTNWVIEDERLRLMLQTLLIDRFQLKFRREQRTGTVYLLERSDKPLRLRPTKMPQAPDKEPERSGFSGDVGFAAGRWVISNTSLSQLAKFACDNILRAPVLDQTKLVGSYDYEQKTVLSEAEADYKDPSDAFLGMIGEVGLKLKSSHGPIDTLVILHAERPAPN